MSLPLELIPAEETARAVQEDNTVYKLLLLLVAALWGSNFASIKVN
jgi:hypothetical protein